MTCGSGLDLPDMFPSIDSADRRFAFLHRVLRGEFPCFSGTIKALRLPATHLAALRFLRLAIPRLHSFSFAPRRTSKPPRPGVGNPVSPSGQCRGSNRISQVPGKPQSSVCTCSKPTPAGLLTPDPYSAATWPLVIIRQRLPRLGLSTLNSMAFGFAVYASQDRSPGTTQNSLPVAGQALLDGVLTRKVPLKGFKAVLYISFIFPKLYLAQVMQPPSRSASAICNRCSAFPAFRGVPQRFDPHKLLIIRSLGLRRYS